MPLLWPYLGQGASSQGETIRRSGRGRDAGTKLAQRHLSVLEMAKELEHPVYNRLALEGTRASSIAISKILNERGLGARVDRWLALEQVDTRKAIARRRPRPAALRAVPA